MGIIRSYCAHISLIHSAQAPTVGKRLFRRTRRRRPHPLVVVVISIDVGFVLVWSSCFSSSWSSLMSTLSSASTSGLFQVVLVVAHADIAIGVGLTAHLQRRNLVEKIFLEQKELYLTKCDKSTETRTPASS